MYELKSFVLPDLFPPLPLPPLLPPPLPLPPPQKKKKKKKKKRETHGCTGFPSDNDEIKLYKINRI